MFSESVPLWEHLYSISPGSRSVIERAMERSIRIAVPEVVLMETVSVVTADWRAQRQQLMTRPTSTGARSRTRCAATGLAGSSRTRGTSSTARIEIGCLPGRNLRVQATVIVSSGN
jgi:hypothetical protein